MIDDDPSAGSYAAKLANAHPRLEIDPVQIRNLDEIVAHIKTVKPDGLLIDLNLTRSKGKAKEHFKFEGPALAQELRTRSNKHSAFSIPMVSLAFKSRREAIVGQDTTASDLFDAEWSKSDVNALSVEIAAELVDLFEGYKTLKRLKSLTPGRRAKTLGLTADEYNLLDPRVDGALSAFSGRPVHNIAQFLLRTLFQFSGPLISTEVLGARLGVDMQKSGKAWITLLGKIPKKVSYRGVFSGSHTLWWMHLINDWWHSQRGVPGSLRMLTADERVGFLKKRFRLGRLKAIEKSTRSPGARYWAVCVRTGVPVDPPEGYSIIDHDQMRSWHDKRYLSRFSALHNVQDTNFEPGEKSRLKKFGKARPK